MTDDVQGHGINLGNDNEVVEDDTTADELSTNDTDAHGAQINDSEIADDTDAHGIQGNDSEIADED